jgi:outer membrane protein assembly factor BamB/plastocyanin
MHVYAFVLFFASALALAANQHEARAGSTDVDWSAFGSNLANSRYSTLSAVKPSNVAKLAGTWVTELDSTSRSTPVVHNGRLFLCSQTAVYALDASTGKTLWTYKTVESAPSQRGVAVGIGLVFAGLSNGGVIALRQDTGSLQWSYADSDTGRIGEMITAAPTYATGTVFASVSGGDYRVNGRVLAFDAASGNKLWQFDTIPAPGAYGSDTWPNRDALRHGGGAVWVTPSVDRQLGLVYVGVGNPVPQFGGELRNGDNLFTDSVVALETKTGRLRWHYQLVHHDIWDADIAAPVILYDDVVGNKHERNLAVMRTDGYLFLLDRATGKAVWPVEERAVKQDRRQKTSRTQPFPVGAQRLGPDCLDLSLLPHGFLAGCWFDPLYYDHPNLAYPGMVTRAAPLSFDPKTRFFYVTGSVSPWWFQRTENPDFFGVTRIPGAREYGILAAIDSHTNRIAWSNHSPYGLLAGGGLTSTASGLLFHLNPDGNLQALRARSGEVLWSYQTGVAPGRTPVGPGGGAVITYEVGGKQFVVTAVNHTVLAFSLEGTVGPRPAPPAPFSVYPFEGSVKVFAPSEPAEISVAALRSDGQKTSINPEQRYMDEYALKPARARVTPGKSVVFTNYGIETHTIKAVDGSWTTGPIPPGESATVTVPKAGRYSYTCLEHPWSLGELQVQQEVAAVQFYSPEQAREGDSLYKKHCSRCHLDSLTGNAHVPALAGASFLSGWKDQTLGSLYDKVNITMPLGAPASLDPASYLAIVAYLLQSNGVPAGNSPLTVQSASALSGKPLRQTGGDD